MAKSGVAGHFCASCRTKGIRTHIEPGGLYCDDCLRHQIGLEGEAPPLPIQPADAPLPAPVASEAEAPQPVGNIAFLRQEIRRWDEANLITPRLAEKLLTLYEPQGQRAPAAPASPDDWPRVKVPLTPGMVLLYLGGILILSAAIMLGSELWSNLDKSGHFILVLLPTLALYFGGAYLCSQSDSRRLAGLGLLFFGCLMVPMMLALGQSLLLGDIHSGTGIALLSLVIHLTTLLVFRSPLLTIPVPMTFLWFVGAAADDATSGSGEGHAVMGSLVVAGLVLVGIAAWLRESKLPAYAAVPEVVGVWVALGTLVILGMDGKQPGWETLSVILCLAALVASVYRRSQIYLMAGAIMLMINIFAIGFEYFGDSVGLPFTLILCGALSIGIGYGIHRVRKDYILAED